MELMNIHMVIRIGMWRNAKIVTTESTMKERAMSASARAVSDELFSWSEGRVTGNINCAPWCTVAPSDSLANSWFCQKVS